MDIEKRLNIGFEEDELIFIQNCIVYLLCCHTSDVQNALIAFEGAKTVGITLGNITVNDMQKRIAETLGVKEEDMVQISKEPEKKITLETQIPKHIM